MSNKGMSAISDTTSSGVSAWTDQWRADDTGIDAFELEGSRRALENLRTLLYGKPMLDLIEHQVEQSEDRFKKWIAESDGQYSGGRVNLKIEGVSTEELFGTIAQILGGAFEEGEARRTSFIEGAVPAHPEHYGFSLEGPGGIETMAGLPTLTFPAYTDDSEVPENIRALIDPTFDVSRVGRALLRDGSVQCYVLQQFRDLPNGMEISLDIFYPAACPPSVADEHLKHYTVEFRNGVRLARAARAAEKAADEVADASGPGSTGTSDEVAGTWHIEGVAGGGKRAFDLTLTVDGERVTGSIVASDGRSADFSDGRVSGSTVTFKASIGMKVAFTLTVDGNSISGKMKAGMLPATQVEGKRLK